MTRRLVTIAALIVAGCTFGCGSDVKKDTHKDLDKPVPEQKDKK